MANLGYALSQGIAAGAQAGNGLIDASLKEDADKRASDQRLNDQDRLLAAHEAMQERIAESAYQRQQRPSEAASALLREASGTQVAASPDYGDTPKVTLSGTPSEVEARINAIRNNPEQTDDSRALVAAYDARKAAEADAKGKTRPANREEIIQAALNNAIQKGDAVSYERLKTLAGDQYTPVPEGGLLNRTTGEVITSGQSKQDREREKDQRQFENKLSLQREEDDRRDARASQLAEQAITRDEKKAALRKSAPLPAAIQKQRSDLLEDIGVSSTVNGSIDSLLQKIKDGGLKLGLIGNFINDKMNKTGFSSDESQAYSDFITTANKLRNDSLRLNKGVQTEGDAIREWDSLFNGITDTDNVKNALLKIKGLNNDAVSRKKSLVNVLQSENGRDPFDFTPFEHPSDKTDMPNGVPGTAKPNGAVLKYDPATGTFH